MEVIRVTVLKYERQLDGLSWNPAFRWRWRHAPLIKIDSDSGFTGLGEAWSSYSQSEEAIAHLRDHVAPSLLGARISNREDIAVVTHTLIGAPGDPRLNIACASAVNIALWDLLARDQDVPLWKALGGKTGIAPVYASGGLYRDKTAPTDLAAEMRGYVDAGFGRIKMKIGALSLEEDLARVCAVRSAVGSSVSIWVDAVNQLTSESAPSWCQALSRSDVDAIQAPVAVENIETMAILNRALPVIASESEFRTSAFEELLDKEAVSYLQFCLGLVGGFDGGLALGNIARTHGKPTTTMCFSTAVLQSASLHFAASDGNVVCAEFHRFHDHLGALMPASYTEVVDGAVQLGEMRGLGLAPLSPGRQKDGGTIEVYLQLE